MKFTQPRLPYPSDALEPIISQRTVDYHYGKHEKTYIDTLNKLIEGTEFENASLEEIILKSEGKTFNNASQAWNHIFYFFQFNQAGSPRPHGHLWDKIEEQFGSFEDFKTKFEEAGTTLFGSGWVWLSRDRSGNLFITQGKDAANPLCDGLTPILVFDVWEHAYYLDYQNLRAEYLRRIWDLVDWTVIEKRYEQE